MKKTISILLEFVLVLTLQLPVFAAGTPTVTATAAKTSVSAGATVTFTISLDNVIEKVSSVEFYLYYDTEAFEFKESTIGNVYSASVVSRPKTDKDGKPYVGVSGINPTSEDLSLIHSCSDNEYEQGNRFGFTCSVSRERRCKRRRRRCCHRYFDIYNA